MTTPTLALPSPKRAEPSLVFPFLLIAAGILFLLANAGYVDAPAWREILALWPVILVLIGVDLLVRPRSMAAAVVAEIAIIAAAIAYVLMGPGIPGSPDSFVADQTVAREGASLADLTIGYGAGNLQLTGGATDLLAIRSTREDIELQRVTRTATSAAVAVRSVAPDLAAGGERTWNVRVPSDIPVALTLNLGAGDFDIDLASVQLSALTISNGASDLTLALPKPSGNVAITISTGASSVTLDIPDGAQYQVRVTGGLNSVSGDTESSGYAAALDRFSITISAGASSIAIR